MKSVWIAVVGCAWLACAGTCSAQDSKRLRAENEELRKELVELEDNLIKQARSFDQQLREARDQLEAEQRKLQALVRESKLREARLKVELARSQEALEAARSLLRKHGIEVPGDVESSDALLARTVSVDFPPGTTLAEAAEFLQTILQVPVVLQGGVGERTLGGLRLEDASLKNVLTLTLATLGEGAPLSWRLEGGAIQIGPKPQPDK